MFVNMSPLCHRAASISLAFKASGGTAGLVANSFCIRVKFTLKYVYAASTSGSVVFASRTPSAVGFARERLIYSRYCCSSSLGCPIEYNVLPKPDLVGVEMGGIESFGTTWMGGAGGGALGSGPACKVGVPWARPATTRTTRLATTA